MPIDVLKSIFFLFEDFDSKYQIDFIELIMNKSKYEKGTPSLPPLH